VIRIYNSLSEKKEILKKPKKGLLKIFVCGPTVYDFPHLGHARTYLIFDSFVRYLKSKGFKVFYLQNITDLDDKIIKRAQEEKTTPLKIARRFEKEYFKALAHLNIVSVKKYARATQHIKEIISQVKRLFKKGYAYKTKDGIYFDISKDKDYGKLSKRTIKQAEDAVSRIDESVQKRNKGDFCLWKFSRKNEPFWPAPFGAGRPGWHIEDTAISEKYFGPQYDIHGGAEDLKFPHHEAEIAQMESLSGKKPFVKIWMHTGLLLIEGKKMSKSLKNFITVNDFLKKYPAEILRWLVLTTHYRSPLNYSFELAQTSQKSYQSLSEFIAKLKFIEKNQKSNKKIKTLSKKIKDYKRKIQKTLDDDFNTPQAIALIFHFLKEWQKKIWQLNQSEASKIRIFLEGFLKNLGFSLKTEKIPLKIIKIAQKRELFRANKQFMQADHLRHQIKKLGYEIEDTPLGPWLKKTS